MSLLVSGLNRLCVIMAFLLQRAPSRAMWSTCLASCNLPAFFDSADTFIYLESRNSDRCVCEFQEGGFKCAIAWGLGSETGVSFAEYY